VIHEQLDNDTTIESDESSESSIENEHNRIDISKFEKIPSRWRNKAPPNGNLQILGEEFSFTRNDVDKFTSLQYF